MKKPQVKRSYRGKLYFKLGLSARGDGQLQIEVPQGKSSVDHQMDAIKFMRWLRETADWIDQNLHHLPVKGG